MSAESMHGLPRPAEYCEIERVRSRMPKHDALQADQSFQGASLQSRSPQSRGSKLCNWQTSASSASPMAGLPQAVACCTVSRLLHRKPTPQEAEHEVHADQGPHLPSSQTSQLCVLQAATSDFDSGWHELPPFRGDRAICRLRRLVPPPQVSVQPPQELQSAHLQSTGEHLVDSHDATSCKGASQLISQTKTFRDLEWLLGHSSLHCDQSLHWPRLQLALLSKGHAAVLHGFASCRLLLLHAPP